MSSKVATTLDHGVYALSSSSAGGGYIVSISKGRALIGGTLASANIENAVYGHLRAIRALGRTRIDSSEISQALKLSVAAVERALNNLTKKGVKIVF